MKITQMRYASGRYFIVESESSRASYLIDDEVAMRKAYWDSADRINRERRKLEHFRAIMRQEMPDLLTEFEGRD